MKRLVATLLGAVALVVTVSASATVPTPVGPVLDNLTILVNFQNDRTEPFTVATADQRVMTNANSLAAYVRDNSYGIVTMTNKTLGWFTIPYDVPAPTCDQLEEWTQAAYAQARAAGYEPTSYDRSIVAFNRNPSPDCALGYGHLGVRAWMNGSFLNQNTLQHEYSHALGLNHAGLVTDVNAPFPYGGNGEYDATWAGQSWTLTGTERAHLTWLTPQVVTADGDYPISPVEYQPSMLRFIRPNGTTIDVDKRAPQAPWADNDTRGLGIRLSSDPPSALYPSFALIQSDPCGGYFLQQGRTYYLPSDRLLIRNDGATVHVDVDADAPAVVPDTTPPTTPTNFAAYKSGNKLNLVWSGSTDVASCTIDYLLYRNGTLISTSSQIGYTDSSPPRKQAVTYAVKARDSAGNISSAATVTVKT